MALSHVIKYPSIKKLAVLLMGLIVAPVEAALLEEVVITAQKREQNLQNVGISITAFSGEQIKELGFTEVSDLVRQTPSLNFVSPFGADGFDSIEVPSGIDVYGTCAGCDLTGYVDTSNDFYETANNREPFLELDSFGTYLTFGWSANDYSIKSITAFEYVDKYFGEDTDATPSTFVDVTNPVDSKQWTQEIQLSYEGSGDRWSTGLYYYNRDLDAGTRTDLSQETFIGFPVNTFSAIKDNTESWALFGQYERELTDALTLITGLRYTDEIREFDMVVTDDSGILPNPAFAFTQATAGKLTKHDSDNYSFRIELNYLPTVDWMWFASIARGVKGAGFNIDLGIDPRSLEDIPFDEGLLLAYEVGFKSTLFGGTTRFNTSVFYYDYEDYQAFSFEGLSNVVSNKDATLYGLDSELLSTPWVGWMLSLGLSLLDTKVEDINTGVSAIDRELTMSPEKTFNAVVQYEWPLRRGVISIQGDARYIGEQHFDILNSTLGTEDSHTVSNLRVTYVTEDEHSSVSLFRT
jgi:iron complex outermembrane recepter protein